MFRLFLGVQAMFTSLLFSARVNEQMISGHELFFIGVMGQVIFNGAIVFGHLSTSLYYHFECILTHYLDLISRHKPT